MKDIYFNYKAAQDRKVLAWKRLSGVMPNLVLNLFQYSFGIFLLLATLKGKGADIRANATGKNNP